MTPDPLTVECPRCKAKPRHGCVARSYTGTWAADTHAGRWKAVGVTRPTIDDKIAAGEMASKHRAELRSEWADRMYGRAEMARHLLNESDLTAWMAEQWTQFAASFSEESKKTLEISFDGLYRVKDHGSVVYVGDDRAEAVLKYNDAR